MIRRKSSPSENIHFIENHCQINFSEERRGKDFNTFFLNEIKLYLVYMSLRHNQNILHYLYVA